MPELTLRDVMTREFVGVSESDTVYGVVRLLREEGVQSGVVLRGREPVGSISAVDVLDVLANGEDVETTTVEDTMRRDPPTLSPDATLGDVAGVMLAEDTDLVLVEETDELLGVITAQDLARYTYRRTEAEERQPDVLEAETAANPANEEGYSSQSICEACGSLSRDLANVNGQLLCPDCREV